MMSLSVMQKVPQIGILRAVGMRGNDIGYIFIFQAIITSIISSVVGILLSLFLIYLDEHYYLIHAIFPDVLFFDFHLILKTQYIVLIFITSLILMIISGLYPAIKAAHLDPVQAIGFRI
jgi:putative ABC transport system permease protein